MTTSVSGRVITDEEMVVEVLQRAEDILRTQGWTQHVMARDKTGRETGYFDESACSFCAMGAIYRAAQDLTKQTGERAYGYAAPVAVSQLKTAGGSYLRSSVPGWNDDENTTIDAVLERFQAASKLLT